MSDYDNKIVLCMGCKQFVKRRDAEFVFWGSMNCHFCKDCLELVKKAKDEGRELTPSDLEMNKIHIMESS